MNRKIRTIQNYTAYVEKSKAGVWACALQLVLLFLCVFSTVLCFSSALAMTVPLPEIILICLLCTLGFAAAFFNKITFGIFAGALLIFGITFLDAIRSFIGKAVEGFKFCYDLGFVIMKAAGWNYTSHMLTDETTVAEILKDEALVLSYFRSVIVVLAVFFAAWFVSLSWKRPRVWPTFLVVFAVLAPGFYIGLAPSPVAFCLLLSGAFGLYIQTLCGRRVYARTPAAWFKSLFKKQDSKRRFAFTAKSGIYGLSVSAISLGFMLLVALITYQTPLVELDNVRKYLDDGSKYVYNRLFYGRLEVPDGSIGSLLSSDEIKLLRIPQIHDVPVFTVNSKHNETFYLRAWVTDDFQDNTWKVLDEKDESTFASSVVEGTDPSTFAYRLHQSFVEERLSMDQQRSFGFVTDDITVKARFHKSLVAHMPTYATDGKITGDFEGIRTTAGENKSFEGSRPGGNRYEMGSFQPVITTKGFVTALYALSQKYMTVLSTNTDDIESKRFQQYMKEERSYAAYAQKKFTDDIGISYDMAERARQLSDSYSSKLAKVLSIERYFRDDSVFTYTTTPEQSGSSDALTQIEYSLFTNQEGYCTYYATAMTLMVRSLGYPARFVSGYIVRRDGTAAESDTYTRTVMDADCHAWVEVYFDGLGWLSFDPTPDATESAQEYEARYYALSLESGGTGGDAGGSVTKPVRDNMDANYVEEQEEDPAQMPEIPEASHALTNLRIALWVLYALLLLIILPAALILYTRRKVKRLYANVYVPSDRPAQTINKMNERICCWLALKGLDIREGESAIKRAERVDSTLATEHKMADILPILTRSAFGQQEAEAEELSAVTAYYEELYKLLHQGKKAIPIWKQIRE